MVHFEIFTEGKIPSFQKQIFKVLFIKKTIKIIMHQKAVPETYSDREHPQNSKFYDRDGCICNQLYDTMH